MFKRAESLEWEGKGLSEQQQESWNVGQVSKTGWKKKTPEWDSVSAGSLSADCVLIFSSFFIFFVRGKERKSTRLNIRVGTAWPSDRPKNSLCCCECQSKTSARQGLPWVTLRRLVRACETDNSLGGLSGLMTRFPGICAAAVLRPGSPSKELCRGAVLPPYCNCCQCYGGTGD